MSSFLKIFAKDIGIDLGTANTVISDAEGNILINEPSVVAVDLTTYELLAVGIEAKNMLGKTPENIMAVRPLENGVIADFELTQAMLSYFINKANKGFSIFQPKAMVTVPSFLTDIEKRAVEDVVIYAGCRDVILIEESVASALGMGFDVNEPIGRFVINIGAGTIQTSIVSLASSISSDAVKYGGDNVDISIRDYVKKNYNFLIGNSTCEYLKNNICTMKKDNLKRKATISGKDLITGMPKFVDISAEDLLNCILPLVNETVDSIKTVLEKTPPEIASEVMLNGIHICGGVSNLEGIKDSIEENIRIKIVSVESPDIVAGIGIGKSLDLIRKNIKLPIRIKNEQ